MQMPPEERGGLAREEPWWQGEEVGKVGETHEAAWIVPGNRTNAG